MTSANSRQSAQPHRPTTHAKFGQFVQSQWLLAGFWMALSALLALAVPFGLGQAVDNGIVQHQWSTLLQWLAVTVLAQIASGFLRYLGVCRSSKLRCTLERDRMTALFNRIMHADMRALPDQVRGEAMGQIIQASSSESAFVEMLYTQGASLAVTLLGTVAALTYLSWQTAFLSLVLCPFSFILWLWLKRKIRPAARIQFEAQESLFKAFTDTFRALTSIRAWHREPQFSARFAQTCQNSLDSDYQLTRKLAIQGPFFDALQALVLIAVFGYGGYLVMTDALTIGVVLAFQVYLMRLFGLLKTGTSIFGLWQRFSEGRIRAAAIDQLPEATPFPFQKAEPPCLLDIRDLTFSFGEHVVWENENLTIREGEYRAILLPSGAGKTTLARCILGLYPIERGTIAIPDGDVLTIGFVCQENVLFDGTLRDNIAMMSDTLSDEKYREVIHLCALEEVETQFGDQSIGDQGARLSGGQQRRVMLARALVEAPRLLIIDQMASELEPELCRTIFGRIKAKYPAMAVLYLGHRMPEW